MENRFIYNFFISPHWTKFLKLPNDYAYILAGSHGVGFAAFIKYFEIINANPMPLNNMFSSLDSVLLYKKQARKNVNKIYGITFDKSYMDNTRRNILKKFKKRVIVFCLVRDPISIIKTHTHHHVINILIDSLDEEGNLKISNENKTKIFNKITNMIMFLASNIIEKSKIKPFFCFTSLLQNIQDSIQKIIYVDTSQIQGEAAYYTMKNIALNLNLGFNYSKKDFNVNYSLVLKNIIKNIFPYTQNLEIHNIPIIYDVKLNSNNAYITDFAMGGAERIFVQCKKSLYKRELKNLKSKKIYKHKLETINEKIKNITRFIDDGGIEELILLCLKNNHFLKENLKKLLEYEISTIKNNAPHILKSWKYYKRFLEL